MAKDTKEPNKAVVKRPMEQLPAFMQNQAGRGLEGLGSGDYEIPRIKLLTGLSPEVIEGGHKAGQFYHTILEEAFDGPFRGVPLIVSKSYMLWRPRDDGGGILARADDAVHWNPPSGKFTVKIDKRGTTATWELKPTVAESGLAEWGTYDPTDPKSAPAATQMINVPFFLPDMPDLSPVVVTFQRGYLSVGRNFVGKLKLSTAPIYGRYFKISSWDDVNNEGKSFKQYELVADGLVQDEAEFKQYEDMHKMFAAMGVKVRDIAGLQGEDSAGDHGGGKTAGGPAPTEEQMKDRGGRAY